jgi:hypothetical protein
MTKPGNTAAVAQSCFVVVVVALFSFTSGTAHQHGRDNYCATTAGGCHVPSPAGNMDGASVFGQYRRMTR